MKRPFSKYHGTGNDFILIDGQLLDAPVPEGVIARLCHRHFGIGADGLIVVNPSLKPHVDYVMDYYNADGKIGSMCGNGARCAFHFAQGIGLAGEKAEFEAFDGMHHAFSEERIIAVSLRDVRSIETRSPTTFILDTGSPHFVQFVTDIASIDVFNQGKEIRYRSEFAPGGVNVNFAQVVNDAIRVRTYERGVEDITMSCGTGVTAVALAFALQNNMSRGPVRIIADGGKLFVDFIYKNGQFSKIKLAGPAEHVYDGTFETDRFTDH